MSETVLKGGISYTEGEIEYTWYSEEGACEKCQALNGLTFKNIDEIPDKPHPNCRCWVEVVDENNSDGKGNASYPDSNKPPEDDEPCDCWDRIQEIMDNIEELKGDATSYNDEVQLYINDIRNNATKLSSEITELEKQYDDLSNVNIDGITGFATNIKENIGKYLELYRISKEAEDDALTFAHVFQIFYENYKLSAAEHGKRDKYYHSKANCESAELSAAHQNYAVLLSIFKELRDYYKKVYKQKRNVDEVYKDCLQDIEADKRGMWKAYEKGTCDVKVLEVEEYFKQVK